MVIQKWDPFGNLRHFERAFARASHSNGHRTVRATDGWAVPLDVTEDDAKMVVKATIPGVAPDDINVTLEDNVLTIEGESKFDDEQKTDTYLLRERKSGKFRRAIKLPDTVDFEGVETTYDQGVLSVTFSKIEARKPRKLEIKV